MGAGASLRYERRLGRLAVVYAPLATSGAWLSLRFGVGALPGGDPARDLVFRGTGLAPPLFLPVLLIAAARLSRRRDATGTAATALAGLVGVAFTAGSTVNLANDVAAARDAGSPVALTVGFAVFHWFLGPVLASSAWLALRSRRASAVAAR